MKNTLEWTQCTLDQSPVLGKGSSQKSYFVKKKNENIFEDTDFNKIKQNVNDKSRHSQKENVHKRRLFQNNREQLETIATTSTTQVFDNTDFIKENKANEKETEQMVSKNNKDSFCAPLNRYMEFCKIISAENFETDVLQNYDYDPVTATIKKLRHIYANSFRQQLLRKKNKQELENVEPAYSVEYQACISSDMSPVEFEVPKSSENRITTVRLQEGLSSLKNDKFHLMQAAKRKKSDDKTHCSSSSYLSRNSFATYNTSSPVVENCENKDTQRSKQSKDQLSKSMNFYIMNDKDSVQLNSQKNSNYIHYLSKSEGHDKNNFSIDIPGYRDSRYINSKHLKTSILSKKHFLKNHSRGILPIAVFDNHAPDNQDKKCNNKKTNKYNVKNVKQVPTILHQYSNDNNLNDSVEIISDYTEDLHKKCETRLFNRNSSNNIEKELYEKNIPNIIFDQTKILEPQIGSMKIKDSQEFQVEEFNINMHSKEHNGRNEFYRCNESLYPRPSETSNNTNVYVEKLPQQEQISPDTRKRSFYVNNHHPINYLQGANFSNSSVELTKEFPQQTKLHVCETERQPPFKKNTHNQEQNILFNFINKRTRQSCQKIFDKTDVQCAKNQINQKACHCNEQHVYFDSANCSRKYKEQPHYFKETAQPENICESKDYNNSIDNCINLSSTMQNIPLLSSKQNNNLPAYPKAIDDHQAVLLQNVTQPVKYLAVKNGSDIQRIPVYINDRNTRIAENVPLKVIAVMDPSTQTKAFPQEIATQVVPLQTDSLHFNDFATRKINDQIFVKRLDSMNTILFNPNLQSNIWYAPNL